ncbi:MULTISPECIES: DUF1801 domain-containing protein [Micrococcaceae]|uniref:DUF1801 domain-containing protein n=1 Tax=Micrococcaceae TaxID=1268 RepID=UPI000B36221B|nr:MULTISPECIES: DUF1801 domain-containing protein [Micrococcaceae]PCC26964.1 hypothetical protein CIK75_00530 [Glutamicibacter sp. BW78]
MSSVDVDAFVSGLAVGWQRDACLVLLEEIRALPTPLEESIKWRNPYFDYNGAVVKWYVAKAWINVYFYKGYLLEDSEGLFEQTDDLRMRTVKITQARPLDRVSIAALLDAAVELNTPGG